MPLFFHDLYDFRQPAGLWMRRGAAECFVQIAMGVPVQHWPELIHPDSMGYHLWHYWAAGPDPHVLWHDLRLQWGDDFDLHVATTGEHPLHRLLINNRIAAARLWFESASWPNFTTPGHDTFWHALAWNCDRSALGAVAEHLDLRTINEQDDAGMTAVSIAAHRGGKDAVQQWLFLGADPDVPDEHQRTLLHHVAQYGDIDWFTEVLDMGADDTRKNDRNQTPTDVVRDRMKHGTPMDISVMKMYWDRRFFHKTMF